RLLMHLRKTQSNHGVDWEELVVTHPAVPQFTFELLDETVRLRLLARSGRDRSMWMWTGHEWQPNDAKKRATDKPEILDDPRLEPMADLGVDGLVPVAQKIGLEQAAHLDEENLKRFGETQHARALRERIKDFKGIPNVDLPATLQAQMRPYQKDGFDFLCHLTD